VEAVRPSLFMRDSSIGTSDPWLLSATPGSIRLAPIRLMSAQDRRTWPEESVLVNLTELAHLDRDGARRASSLTIPLAPQVVLLLSWSVVPTLARLDAVARRSPSDGQLPDEDWLTTWHHFVETDDAQSSAAVPTMTRRASALDVLLSPGPRRYVFGTVCGDPHTRRTDALERASVKSRQIRTDDRPAAIPDSRRREMASPSPWGTAEPCPLCVGSHHAVR
jgi:hypothetical protein